MALKRTVILFPAAFLMNVNLLMINFAVIFFLKDMIGLSASTIGWFFAAGYGGYAAGCLLLRPVQNKIPPPVSMFLTLFLAVFSLFMIKNSTSPGKVLIYYLIFSTAPAFYWPQLMGWFSYGLTTKELNTSISRFNISWSTGALCGPLLGGLIAEWNIMYSFYIDIIMIAGMGIFLALGLIFIRDMRNFPVFTQSVPDGPATHEAGLEAAPPEKTSELINSGRGTIMRFAGWVGVFSSYSVLGLLNNIFPLFIRDTLGLGESVAGSILFVRGVATAVGFFIAGRIVKWHFNRRVMLITQALTAVSMVLLIFVKAVPTFYVLFIVYGLLFSMAYSNGIFHGSAGATDRGRRMALFETFLTMGIIVGSIAGGYLFQYFSINIAFSFCALLLTAGLIIQIVILSFGKRHNLA